ncbi:MAG: UPF0758 protein [Patescibacteria group bacterium]|nr:MAG: UPF0758 protein [Patescibacteria group bacterium]
MKMSLLPEEDRPIEKLLNKGADILSDAELTAIILSSGGKGSSVLELSQKIIRESGSLYTLLNTPVQKLIRNKYLGKVKAARLSAIKELINRYNNPPRQSVKVSGPNDAYEYVKPNFFGKETEHLYLISLNSRNITIKKSLVSAGTINETLIHPREIIRTAIMDNAVSIILAHNHPSGEPNPSTEDVKITKRVQEACQIVGINLIDHLIVCDKSFSSMRAQNLLKGGE